MATVTSPSHPRCASIVQVSAKVFMPTEAQQKARQRLEEIKAEEKAALLAVIKIRLGLEKRIGIPDYEPHNEQHRAEVERAIETAAAATVAHIEASRRG